MSADERDPIDRLCEEFVQRFRAGEDPAVSEYIRRHPEHAAEIRELFPALLLIEELAVPQTEKADIGEVPQAGRRLGEYRLLREIGRGGMAVVYEAEQETLGRRVALKVLPFFRLEQPNLVARFRKEVQIAARLHHNNIVPVFGVGESEGVHYYAMQFIDGRPLGEVITELRRLRANEAPSSSVQLPGADVGSTPGSWRAYYQSVARLGLQIAEALSYAHGLGILHRDIKPSNLLLDYHGRVWITDFGLAKAVDNESLTRTGELVGTVAYMPPERFKGEGDHRADLYGLGLVLFELATLTRAFEESDPQRLIRDICETAPVRPRQLAPDLPRDLETIILKAIAPHPQDRYDGAAALADDLRRWLDRVPIRARRSSVFLRLRRWSERNPLLACSVLGLLLALATGLVVSLLLLGRVRDERDRTHDALRAEQAALSAAARDRDRAVDSFRTLVEEVEGHLRESAATQEQRKRLLDVVLRGLNDILGDQDGPSFADLVFVSGLRRLAGLEMSVGRSERAHAYREKALGIARHLHEAYPQRRSAAAAFARALAEVAADRLEAGRIDEAAQRASQAEKLLQKWPAGSAGSPSESGEAGLRADIAVLQARILCRRGEFQVAEARYVGVIAELEAVCADTSAEAGSGLRESLAQAHTYFARALLQGRRDAAGALPHFERAVELREQSLAHHPRGVIARRNVASARVSLTTALRRLHRWTAAAAVNGKQITTLRTLVADDPRDFGHRQALADALITRGDIRLAYRDGASPWPPYREALALLQAIRRADPKNTKLARAVARAHARLAETRDLRADPTQSLKHARASARLFRELATAASADARKKRDLAIALEKLGDAALRVSAIDDAEKAYRENLDLARGVAEPNLPQARMDLYLAYWKLAELYRRAEKTEQSRRHYAAAAPILEALAEKQPQTVQFLADLVTMRERRGLLALETERWTEGAALFRKAVAALEKYAGGGRQVPHYRAHRDYLEFFRRICELAPAAMNDAGVALKQPARERAELLSLRALHLARRGQFEAAAQTAESIAQATPAQPQLLYQAAVSLAGVVRRAKQTDGDVSSYVDRALAMLGRAVDAGFVNNRKLVDPAFLPVRDDPRYGAILKRAAAARKKAARTTKQPGPKDR